MNICSTYRFTLQRTREDEDVLEALDVVELREDGVDDARGVARLVAAPVPRRRQALHNYVYGICTPRSDADEMLCSRSCCQ